MRSHLDGHPASPPRSERLCQSLLGGGHLPFFHHFSLTVQHAVATHPVAQVHADRHCLGALFPLPHTLSSNVILFHGRSPFALRVRFHWELIASRRGPAFSYHLGNGSAILSRDHRKRSNIQADGAHQLQGVAAFDHAGTQAVIEADLSVL